MSTEARVRNPSLVVREAGAGLPVLVLHGGGGPDTVAPVAAHLAETRRVLTPTLPGWDGVPRPQAMISIGDYAQLYLDELVAEEMHDVVVIGSSLGGWIAAEMAVRDRTGVITGVVLLDAAGITVPGEPITDFFSLGPRELFERSFHDPDRFFVDPASVAPDQAARQEANLLTMATVARDMSDPRLRAELANVTIPVLVVWGDSDRLFTPEYGRAYADSFANGRFAIVSDAGHLPQLEQPGPTLALIDEFLGGR